MNAIQETVMREYGEARQAWADHYAISLIVKSPMETARWYVENERFSAIKFAAKQRMTDALTGTPDPDLHTPFYKIIENWKGDRIVTEVSLDDARSEAAVVAYAAASGNTIERILFIKPRFPFEDVTRQIARLVFERQLNHGDNPDNYPDFVSRFMTNDEMNQIVSQRVAA